MANAMISAVKKFPDGPGVYFFVGKGGKVLYAGRATSLRDRVLSYFGKDALVSRGPLIARMVKGAKRVKFIKTDSVLEAIILEANLIKKLEPPYNTKEKSDKSFNHIVITKDSFPRVLVVRGKNLEEVKAEAVFGPFPHGGVMKEALRIIRKIFPFRDKCSPGSARPCFDRQIGLCPGVCTGEISEREYRKTIVNIRLFLSGRKRAVVKNLEREMKTSARCHEFEKAGELKKKIFSLKHIQDVSLIKNSVSDYRTEEKEERIEGYDIAHLGGRWNVGVMTVVKNGALDKSSYRKFRIKESAGGDVGNLKEILTRRLKHPEWGMPSLVVMDGGKAQKAAAEKILKEFGLKIPVVSVVKDEKHKPREILGDKKLAREFEKEILLVNSEAHRFAVKYHRSLRSGI